MKKNFIIIMVIVGLSCTYIPSSSYSWNPQLKKTSGIVEKLFKQDFGLGKTIFSESFPKRSNSSEIILSNIEALRPFINHEITNKKPDEFLSWANYVYEECDSSGSGFTPWPHYSFVNVVLLKENTGLTISKQSMYFGNPNSLTSFSNNVTIRFDLNNVPFIGQKEESEEIKMYHIEATLDMVDNIFSGLLPTGRYLMAVYLKKNYYIEVAVYDDYEYPEQSEMYLSPDSPFYLKSAAWIKIKDILTKLGATEMAAVERS